MTIFDEGMEEETMKQTGNKQVFSTAEITQRIEAGFAQKYKAFSNFPQSGKVWDECLAAAQDAKLMNNLVFCNDVLQIPPVKVFLLANATIGGQLADEEKKSIGAFWGFVFKFVFGYKNQKSVSVRVADNNLKSATYFFDCPQEIEVVLGKFEDVKGE